MAQGLNLLGPLEGEAGLENRDGRGLDDSRPKQEGADTPLEVLGGPGTTTTNDVPSALRTAVRATSTPSPRW